MLSKNTMITFYRACGYGPNDAEDRAYRYMELQRKWHESGEAMAEMYDQDEKKLEETKNGK